MKNFPTSFPAGFLSNLNRFIFKKSSFQKEICITKLVASFQEVKVENDCLNFFNGTIIDQQKPPAIVKFKKTYITFLLQITLLFSSPMSSTHVWFSGSVLLLLTCSGLARTRCSTMSAESSLYLLTWQPKIYNKNDRVFTAIE